eukprot:680363-Pelagomonas_calceolata.AAC.1
MQSASTLVAVLVVSHVVVLPFTSCHFTSCHSRPAIHVLLPFLTSCHSRAASLSHVLPFTSCYPFSRPAIHVLLPFLTPCHSRAATLSHALPSRPATLPWQQRSATFLIHFQVLPPSFILLSPPLALALPPQSV